VRFVGYCIVTEPYLLLVFELTHGLTFAAFWTSVKKKRKEKKRKQMNK